MNLLEITELVNDEAMVGMTQKPGSLSLHIASILFLFCPQVLNFVAPIWLHVY